MQRHVLYRFAGDPRMMLPGENSTLDRPVMTVDGLPGVGGSGGRLVGSEQPWQLALRLAASRGSYLDLPKGMRDQHRRRGKELEKPWVSSTARCLLVGGWVVIG